MAEHLRLSISEARARLPELAQRVMDSPHEVVIIEHRDYEERVVLTSERHLQYLEALAENTRMQKSAKFKLAGSITSDLSDDELAAALAALREEAAAAAAAKLARILGE